MYQLFQIREISSTYWKDGYVTGYEPKQESGWAIAISQILNVTITVARLL
jgi:hypothetical protein